jgi:lecithin:retinol acyltransferase
MLPHSLPLGAHLATPRLGYTHHGIYAGNGRVIHYPGFKRLFCRGRVEEVSLDEFAQGRALRVIGWQSPKFSGAERAERARSRLGEESYRFWSNNCEHFAHWCVFGTSHSAQVELQRMVFLALGFALSLFSTLIVAG